MPRSRKRTAKARQKRTSKGQARETALLEALEDALSADERARTFAGALLSLDDAGRARLLERLGPDTAQVLSPFLADGGKRGEGRQGPATAGKAKTRELWDGLWREWEERLFASGAEEGDYVHQDHHWEQPYFDPDGVAADLEAIAKRIRALAPRVWELGLAPAFSFAEQIVAADDEIGSALPDWLDSEGFTFGGETTCGLLEWEWRVAQREEIGSYAFVARIRETERSLEQSSLDGEALARFLKALPEDAQRQIFEGMGDRRHAEEWKVELGSPHSVWFALFQRWAKRWDPRTFDEQSRANVAKDWTLALPLLTNHLQRKQFAEARALAIQAVRGVLHLDPGEAFDPSAQLLVRHLDSWRPCDEDGRAFRVLAAWQKASAALGEKSLSNALALQPSDSPARSR